MDHKPGEAGALYDWGEEHERRTAQFHSWLGKMRSRTKVEGHIPSFIIFDENKPDRAPEDGEAMSQAKVLRLVTVAATGSAEFGEPGDATYDDQWPTDGWRGDQDTGRFVQFRFDERYFYADIPRTVLFTEEARRLFRDRRGFFFMGDRTDFPAWQEDIEKFRPVLKIYVYGDERCAAEDTSYFFFQLWRFPVDWRFYVTAFSRKKHFERGRPLE